MARGWRVTLREGSEVSRESFPDLGGALAEARRRVEIARGRERPETISAFRDFTPEQQVLARVEISGPGLMRGPEGGVDVMGDGRVVAYTGTIRKQVLEAAEPDEALSKLGEALD